MSSITASGLLGPIAALNGWTLVMEITKSQMDAQMPAPARWKRDNYNHLFEQPTQFYAIALALAVAHGGKIAQLDSILAWTYVGVRVLHSLVQSTTNTLSARFLLFGFSSSILAVMTGRLAMLVL
ncbi:unnamed protein product [Penicillium crustosum]